MDSMHGGPSDIDGIDGALIFPIHVPFGRICAYPLSSQLSLPCRHLLAVKLLIEGLAHSQSSKHYLSLRMMPSGTKNRRGKITVAT
jgi:hypothetical protein